MSDGAIQALLTEAVRAGQFPGASYAFGTAERTETGEVGKLGYGEEWARVQKGTRYDLASLTKVVATTPVVHRLWTEGTLRLDTRVGDVVPEFRHGDVTIEHLLRHESGLPAYVELKDRALTPDLVWDTLCRLDLERRPGEATVYSCVGFVVLQRAIERLTDRDLDELCSEFVFTPLGMNAEFGPLTEPVDNVAPTGRLEPWHGAGRGWLQGRVHDPIAYLQGGVSGNAGLFGTAKDVATFCQSTLSDLSGWTAWTGRRPGHDRGLGWDLKSDQGSSAGSTMSSSSFGHTGFTGTSLWIDPVAGVFAVLLTNAVHPLGTRTDLRELRSRYGDLALKAVQPRPASGE